MYCIDLRSYGGGAIVLTVGIFCKWNETFFVMLRYFYSLSLLFDFFASLSYI